jgi:hypothetical protein
MITGAGTSRQVPRHEHYQKELAELVATAAGPLGVAIAELRARHDIDRLTPPVLPSRL